MATIAKVERKFLPTEAPFQTTDVIHNLGTSRFPKIHSLYVLNVYRNEHNVIVHEWTVTDSKELKTLAQMYYKRYNILSR